MEVVIIPFEYEKLSPAEQTAIVPICIKSTDEAGNPIDRGWFEAVARVQDPLRTLAKFWLDDVWRVSEITEAAVHTLWCRSWVQAWARAEQQGLCCRQMAGTGPERRGLAFSPENSENVR
jgi:hypothetical protein